MTATITRPRPIDANLEAKAALAEALHVDGCFDPAARLWGGLADAGYRGDHPALKAAVSCYAAGRSAAGHQWLERAKRDGTPAHECLYVAAQAAWARGDEARASFLFAQVWPEDDGGRAETALGVLLWRQGRSAEAIGLFRDAASREDGALARMNLVNVGLMCGRPPRDAAGVLASVAIDAPQRVEPHVLYARLLRREGDEEHARAALGSARLREGAGRQALGGTPAIVPSAASVAVGGRSGTAGRSRRVRCALSTLRELWEADAVSARRYPSQVAVKGEVANRASEERLLRDVGRQWWSKYFSTAPGDRWVVEGLAEYGLHLADAAGVIPGYVAAARADLMLHGEGALPSTPIAELRSNGSSMVARLKAGWLMSMLREILGPDGLDRVLRLALVAGARAAVDAYAFAALASYVRGHSLRWLFRQWVESDAELKICLSLPATDGAHVAIWREGLAAPGAPVDIEVSGYTSPRPCRSVVDLELVANPVRVAAEPGAQVVVDPDLRWYTTVEVKPQQISSCPGTRSASSRL